MTLPGVSQARRRCHAQALTSVLAGALMTCALAEPALAKEKDDRKRLEATLRQVLAGKEATAKIVLGTSITYYEELIGQEVTRPVCTDVNTSGEVTYVVPWMAVPPLPKIAVDPSSLRKYVSPDAGLRVTQVKVQKDRVALHLQEVSTGRGSRLRLWFQKGFATGADSLEVLEDVPRVLDFEGVLGDVLARAEASRLFPSKLREAQVEYGQAGLAGPEKLARGVSVLTLLEEEIARRRAWAGLVGQPGEVSELEATRASLEQEIARLGQEVHGPRLSEIRGALDRVAREVATLRQSMTDASTSQETLNSWHSHIQKWQSLVEEYAALRGPGWVVERKSLDQSLKELAHVTRLRALQAEEEAALATQAAREAFGDAPATSVKGLKTQQRDLDRYRELVAERRGLLSRLASPAPVDVEARLEADESRVGDLEKLFAQGQEELRPDFVKMEYRSLQTRRARLYDEYTLAFGGSRHRAAGRALVEHIDGMIRNRREASSLGDSAAASHIEELRKARRKIQSQTP